MQALGMIEVIGLPPAIEAADSALKAANVILLAIAKADAGILTVEITGDVGAVTAAIDAGAAAAERVGTLRAKHVIPHVDESLVGKVLMKGTKLFQPKKNPTIPINQSVNSKFSNFQDDTVEEVDMKSSLINNGESGAANESLGIENIEFGNMGNESPTMINEKKIMEGNPETKNKEPRTEKTEPITTYTATELKKKSNDTLRAILQSQGVEITELHKSAKKQELIQLIIAQQNRR